MTCGVPADTAVCTIDGCEREHVALGLCRRHYWARYKLRRVEGRTTARNKGLPCVRKGCTADANTHGLCKRHYDRSRYEAKLAMKRRRKS